MVVNVSVFFCVGLPAQPVQLNHSASKPARPIYCKSQHFIFNTVHSIFNRDEIFVAFILSGWLIIHVHLRLFISLGEMIPAMFHPSSAAGPNSTGLRNNRIMPPFRSISKVVRLKFEISLHNVGLNF